MSLIHLAILTKVLEGQQKRTGARPSSSKKNESKRTSYSSIHNDKTVDIEDFLEDLLSTDQEATKVFLLLKDCQKQIDDEDNQKLLEEIQKICKEYDEQYKLLQTEKDKLASNGVILDSTSVLKKYCCSVKVEQGRGFGGYGSYGYNPASYQMGFNGMPLTREIIENNINQFQIDLDAFNKENPELDNQLLEIKAKITKQKRSIKYSPFNKPKKQSLLTEMLKLEKEIQEKIDYRTTLEKQSKAFAALTEKQKKAILTYMDQVANCIEVGQRLSIAINEAIAIHRDFHGNESIEKRNVHQRMLERAAEKGDLSIEELEAIIDRVKTTMKEHRKGYDRYERLSNKSYTTWPNSPESRFAAEYFKKIYKEKNKTKK